MASTYYDSQLTAAEIEAVLEAIDGVIVPANNGKVLAINNGKLEARSVQWGGGGGGNYQSKTVTPSATQQTVEPDSGYDALSSVIINGDEDLVAGNIKKDVEIFGVTGSYEGGGDAKLYSNVRPFIGQTISLEFGVNATVVSSSAQNGNLEVSIAADSNWEGFDIKLVGLTSGKTYKFKFTLAYTGEFLGQFPNTGFGCRVRNTVSGSYFDAQTTFDFIRDGNSHEYEIEFTCGADSYMYFSVPVYAFTDGNHIVTITNMRLALAKFTANGDYTVPSGYDGFEKNIVTEVLPVLQSKTVGENGTVFPDSGYDGLSSVVVNVGGGGSTDIDYTYLPYSVATDVLASADQSMYDPEEMKIGTLFVGASNLDMISPMLSQLPADETDGIAFTPSSWAVCWLSDANTDVTCYAVIKRRTTNTGELFPIGVPYALSGGNDPLFDFDNNSGSVIYSTWGTGNVPVSGKNSYDYHLYAISVDATNKVAKFYCDGIYLGSKTFNNSGNNVCFGRGTPIYSNGGYSGYTHFKYGGVVKGVESDSVIIANMQTIMQKLGINS